MRPETVVVSAQDGFGFGTAARTSFWIFAGIVLMPSD